MRDGQRVPLEPRALAVLLLMVRSEGKLLRKESILQAVWKDTVVEESSLTRAVALLRKQLGDDPRHPAFIETVPTLGYRFIAAVRTASASAPAVTETIGGGTAPDAAEAPGGTDLFLAAARPTRQRHSHLLALLGVVLLVAVAIGVRLAIRHHAVLPAKRSVVLAEFVNSTGEPVFDGALHQGLIAQLEQSPILSLVSEPRIQSLLRLMGQPPGTAVTSALGRELCRRAAAAALLEGSISTLGGRYVLGLRATECSSGDVLDTEQMQASSKEEVLRTLDLIAGRLRGRLGESLTSVANLDTPLTDATTSSLEALQALGQANRVQNLNGSAAAIPLVQRAIALDPQFAMAHAVLGRLYGDIGQETRSAESAAEAYKFRDRASERERFFIAATYEIQVTGNLEKAEEICETWGRVYPRDPGSLGFPAGLILRVFGRYDEAVANAQRLVDAEPDFAMAYHLLAVNEIALGRLDAARRVLDGAAARHLDIPQYVLDRHRLAFLEGDTRTRERLTSVAATQPATEAFVYAQEATTLAYFGQMAQSRDIAQRALALALQLEHRDAAARLEAGSAIRESLIGNAPAAARHANAALALSTGRDALYGAAFAFAMSGDSAAAARLADDLVARFPADTAAQFHYLPAIRALVAANGGDPGTALDALKLNAAYELGSPPSFYTGLYGVMYPTFVRGTVYLRSHRGTEAAAEFRKIIGHPALLASDPLGAVARVELARALVMAGERERAKAAYSDFLELWTAADADIPLLQAAKAEYSRL